MNRELHPHKSLPVWGVGQEEGLARILDFIESFASRCASLCEASENAIALYLLHVFLEYPTPEPSCRFTRKTDTAGAAFYQAHVILPEADICAEFAVRAFQKFSRRNADG